MKKIFTLSLVILILLNALLSVTMFAACDPAYNVNFETNGGTSVKSVIGALAHVEIEKEPITTREGYDFMGWYENPAFSGDRINFPVTFKFPSPNCNSTNRVITLYAKWRSKPF